MKKTLSYFFMIFILLTLTSCEHKSPKKQLTIAMIGDLGNIDDKSFNQIAFKGVQDYAKEVSLPKKNYFHVSSPSQEQYTNNLSNFSDKKTSLIITPGYYSIKTIDFVASKYPEQKFLLLDGISDTNLSNIFSVSFANNEGSFLVGVCAALKANEYGLQKVGFLGGIDSEITQKFEAGFEAGVKIINSKIKIITKYANDFASPLKGQKIASKMFDEGVDIVFNVAGSTGNGLIKEAKKRSELGSLVWVIGVDKDQYTQGIYDKNKSVILTSMVKRLDIATYDTIKSVANGTFKGGHFIYTLKNNGVSLPKTNPNLKKEWLEIVEHYKKQIVEKKIIVPNIPKRVFYQ